MENEQHIITSPSLKHKLKKTLCLSCSLNKNRRETAESPSSSSEDRPRLIRASSMWLKSRAHELPEIRDKCKHLINRIGRHRRHASTDFRYDPFSYALNFDEGYDDNHLGDANLRDFSSRLPASPPQRKASADDAVAVPIEIKVFS